MEWLTNFTTKMHVCQKIFHMRISNPALVILSQCVHDVHVYCIAGNFWGRKPSRIYSHLWKFSPQNFRYATPIYVIPRKFSPRNAPFLPICESFLPQKFPAIRYIHFFCVLTRERISMHMHVNSVLPRLFQHSTPPCLQYPYIFDVVTKVIHVVTNSSQTTPTPLCVRFLLGRTLVN